MVVLVLHDPGQHRQGPPGQIVPDVLLQGLDALGIVAAVDDEQGIMADDLEPAGPVGGGQPPADMGVGNGPAPGLKHPDGRQGHGGIAQLVPSQQRQAQAVQVLPIENLALQPGAFRPDAVEIRQVQGNTQTLAPLADDLLHAVGLAVQHRVTAGLDDPGLGGGDFFNGVPQILGVVQADVAEHGGLRGGDHVGGVKFAAHAHLAHHDIAVVPGEIGEGDGRDHLKLRRVRVQGVRQRADLGRDFAQLVVGDLLAVHLHALVEPDQEGRGVQARAIARRPEDAGHYGTGGALSVGAGDVDELHVLLGIPHQRQQRPDALQSRDAAAPADGVDIRQGFVNVHCISFPFDCTGGRPTARRAPERCRSHTTSTSSTPVMANCTLRAASRVRKYAAFAPPP